MANTYIKFNASPKNLPDNLGKKLVQHNLDADLPKANPDFAEKVSEVCIWLIEFEDDSYYPNREIGLDSSGKAIMIMPWKNNYGYWTDNNLVMKDFTSRFKTVSITSKEFNEAWRSFESLP